METGLAWGVKESFLRYVSSDSTAEIAIGAGAEALVGGGFYFAPGVIEGPRLAFHGIVSFRAHGGLLRVVIADPVIDLDARLLFVRVDEQGTLRPFMGIDLPPSSRSGDYELWQGVATALRPESVEAFGDVYAPGTPFDPLTVRVATTG